MTHDELPGVLRQAAEIMREAGKPALRELLLAAAEEIERLRGESIVSRGTQGRRVCVECGTEEGVHGGCTCGRLQAWRPAPEECDE